MKKAFETPEIKFLCFEVADIITVSEGEYTEGTDEGAVDWS